MAFANHFYNKLTRKYVAVFGSLFNRITINRYNDEGEAVQSIPVPISFGPWQKYLLRLKSDPNLDRKYQILLPRMSFELENISYDPSRRISQVNKLRVSDDDGNGFVYVPTPYILNFTLSITALNMEDGMQIIEQIIPFFQPSYTPSVHLIEGLSEPIDLSIDLEQVTYADAYEGDFDTSRLMIWTLMFTMKGWYFGPVRKGKVIKFVDVQNKLSTTGAFDQNYLGSIITVQPGMDVNGNPTTDIDDTVEYVSINNDDNWDYLKQLHTFEELVEKDLVNENPNPHETNGKL